MASLPSPAALPGEVADYLEGLMEGFVVYDAGWRMTYINGAGETILGRRREEVLGKTWHQAFPHAVGNRVDLMYQRVMAERRSERIEHYYAHYGKWLEIGASPVRTGGIAVYFRDSTERNIAERALRESEEQLRFVTDHAPALIVHCDAQARFRFVNAPYAARFGLRAEQVVGKRIAEVVGAAAYETIQPYVRAALAGERVEFEQQVPYGELGPMWMHCVYVPQSAPGGGVSGFVGVIQDVSKRKAAEQSLREADRRKDEFLATLAHELRNPLAPIRNAVEILGRQGPPDPILQSARDMIDRQVGHMVRLIDDLLDVSRITQGKIELRRERIALTRIVEQALETSRPHLGHELTVALPPEPIYFDADPVRLAQVFSNLLNNACKYTEKGGRIWLTAERQGAQALIKVKDSGIGIAPQHLPRLFQMFSQAPSSLERAQGGLGVGLSLTRGLVEMHGGTIEAHSEGPGQGSEFSVRLPALDDLPAPQPMRTEPYEAAKGPAGRRILVVEDNRDTASSLAALLRMEGNEVEMAHDGLEALQKAQAYQPEVVLLDIGLPKVNGYDACRAMRAQPWGKHMLIVAVTGWGQDEDRRRSKEAGFDVHLVKPVDHPALLELLAEVPAARPSS